MKLPRYIHDVPHLNTLFDHSGETIIDGRLALVTEPYSRGRVDALSLAVDFAEVTKTELRFCLPTWHGYGTMRFAWLAPLVVNPPKWLSRFVDLHALAADVIRKLLVDLPPKPADRDTLIAAFWNTLQAKLPSISTEDSDSIRCDATAFLAWNGYPDVRRKG